MKLPNSNKMRMSVVFAGLISINGIAGADAIVKIDGSSTVYPITEAVAEDFQKDTKGAVRVTVGISGTGGGFKKFCRGETDIVNASRPILKRKWTTAKKRAFNMSRCRSHSMR